MPARRLATIATDRQGWSERAEGAASQIATLEARVEEAKTERAGLEDAPQVFEEKRRTLIGERLSFLLLSHFRTENGSPLFPKMLYRRCP